VIPSAWTTRTTEPTPAYICGREADAHSPRPGGVHHGANVGLGRGGGDRATSVQDEAVGVSEQGDELTRFRFDERGRAERDDGTGVESTPCEETETKPAQQQR